MMNHAELDQYLRSINAIEAIQIHTGQNVPEFGGIELLTRADEKYPRMPEELFFDNGSIFISKHHRFAPMPIHVHSFVEINYMYAGCCTQVINGQRITLQCGQMCLLDMDVPHELEPLGEQDILVNIIMKKETLSAAFLNRLSRNGLVGQFLLNVITENSRHDRYVIFHAQDNENLHYMLRNMMCECFDPTAYSQEMIYSYTLVMFTELMRVYQHDTNYQVAGASGRTSLLEVLQYIEEHYRTCTLKELARQFSFNANYLSNLLKKQTGQTFSQLVRSQRMLHAAELLRQTDRSIEQIVEEVGYESLSFFYDKFAGYYGMTPAQYRKQHQNSRNPR
ncbi:AraC family transcriptional regulator [Paenibacillus sp. WLX1005]|uniref:AraC family transcriptional regulator n=1 Tax=Paenibacillus sp. WLX1005 TaxID=3243766 RepID=UPI003983E35C